jgi:hypothetical protein
MVYRIILIVTLSCGMSLGFSPLAQEFDAKQAIDPEADKILRNMSNYLDTLKQFSVGAFEGQA